MEGYKSTPDVRRELINLLWDLWESRPYERLGQLIFNTIDGRDLFHIKDEYFLSMLNSKADRSDILQKRKYKCGFKFTIGKLEFIVVSAFVKPESSTIFYNCYCQSITHSKTSILAEYIIDGCMSYDS